MNAPTIAILVRMELRSILRDTRVVVFSILLPFLLTPLMLLASRSAKTAEKERAEQRTITIAITGARADEAKALVERAAKRDPKAAITIQEAPSDDPAAALMRGDIDGYVELVSAEEAKATAEAPINEGPPPPNADKNAGAPALPVLILHYRQDRTTSSSAESALQKALADERRESREAELAEKGLPRPPAPWLERRDLATHDELSGSRVGAYLTAILLLFMLVGGASIASDSIAGEKERGTLETLLSAGAGRSDLLAAKLLLIFSATIFTTLIQLINLSVCAYLGLIDASAAPILLTLRGSAPLLAFLFLPVSALVASVLLFFFGMAKSYKEAQLYFTPITLAGPALALAPALPGVELRSAIAAVPLVGVSVAVRDVLKGTVDAPMIAVAWISTALAAAFVARTAGRVLSSERLILPSEGADPKDGQGRLEARVLAWFAALWALYFLMSASNTGLSVIGGAVLGQVLFLVFTATLIRGYKLKIREALSLRLPNPIVWPAVLLGAPSAVIVANDLFSVVSRFLPFPKEMLEDLAKKLTPAETPAWLMLVLFAALPGVCEELTFRGVLLYGLRRRLRPWVVCLVVGAIFGVFHLALFRLFTTAFLGALLTAVVLLTGSILPSMLWHALNNGIALIVIKTDLPVDALPPWAHGAAILTLALSFYLLWIGRSKPASPARGV